nr:MULTISPECIES: hypothetical protein [unclassified Mesorhizobium]
MTQKVERQPPRDLRQHAGNDEFGGAEGEGGDEQGNQRKHDSKTRRTECTASDHAGAQPAMQKLSTPL